MHAADAENRDRTAMTRTQHLLRILAVLLATHIPAGPSSAGEWTRGAYTCTGDAQGGAVPDYEETADHVLHAFCLAIQGRAGEGIPALHNLAERHVPNRLDARFLIAEYRATDGRFGSIASPDLTVKQIDDAIQHYFGALATMKLFGSYPEPDYAELERLLQMELKASHRVPRLYLHRFRMGFLVEPQLPPAGFPRLRRPAGTSTRPSFRTEGSGVTTARTRRWPA